MFFTIKIWLRAIRINFLLTTFLGILIGLTISWYNLDFIDIYYTILIIIGILSLHISVDLLNDYWDFKRGIDQQTTQTKFSGGSGVLPNKLLKPLHIFVAGIIFLLIGSTIGSYFVLYYGIIIFVILLFAVLSVYFYSTTIINHGLSEIFVIIKGILIIIGICYIQTFSFYINTLPIGIITGLLSSLVLFIASLPDFNADKSMGRKTLIIIFGIKNIVPIAIIFLILIFSTLLISIIYHILPFSCIILFAVSKQLIKIIKLLQKYDYKNIKSFEYLMQKILSISKIMLILLIIGIIINI